MQSYGTPRRALDTEVLEIVEDSEPEREEQRRNWRTGNHTVLGNHVSVIELTGEMHSIEHHRIIVDAQEDSSDSDTPLPPKSNQVTTIRTTSINPPTSYLKSSDKPIRNTTSTHPPEPFGGLNLQNFAFQKTVPSTSKVANRAPSTKPGPRKATRPLSNEQTVISSSDADLITECVSCNVKWTARKTSVQKVAHILSCAKERGLEVSTIRVLVQKQIQNKPSSSHVPAPTILPSIPGATKTLFENVAPSVQPKKRNVQKEIQTLLSTPRSSRDAILSKAQAVLCGPNDPLPRFSATIIYDEHQINNEDEVTSDALRFGQSMLGQRLSSNKPNIISKSYEMEPPPAETCDRPRSCPSSESELINHFSVLNVGTSPSYAARVAQKSLEPQREATEEQIDSTTPKKSRRSPAFDEKWVSYMKERIQMDQTLHLRILRYEPIHFDVFLKMAESYSPLTNRLKYEVRIFLDSQAIHFFGAGGIWGRK